MGSAEFSVRVTLPVLGKAVAFYFRETKFLDYCINCCYVTSVSKWIYNQEQVLKLKLMFRKMNTMAMKKMIRSCKENDNDLDSDFDARPLLWSDNISGLKQIPFTKRKGLLVPNPGNKPIDFFFFENIVRKNNKYALELFCDSIIQNPQRGRPYR
ncbi:hypothetical protein J6590_087933 [Homalodisca vitripennis]|nr:hypothetical protein J6590_087933 [Homalodisca vitripennis]